MKLQQGDRDRKLESVSFHMARRQRSEKEIRKSIQGGDSRNAVCAGRTSLRPPDRPQAARSRSRDPNSRAKRDAGSLKMKNRKAECAAALPGEYRRRPCQGYTERNACRSAANRSLEACPVAQA